MKKDFFTSSHSLIISSVLVYIIMLFLNILTPYVADDYVYMFSFFDKKPIAEGTLIDVAKSMYVHSYKMNGRILSHSIEQIFMFFPKIVFNLINAGVFTAVIYNIYKIINYKNEPNSILFILITMVVWIFTPVFGEVFLWQVGSVNYLWSILLGLAFLSVYIIKYVYNKDIIKKRYQVLLFTLLSFIMGTYSEVTSFICIISAIILFLLTIISGNKKKMSYLLIPLFFSILGYIVLLKMPCELQAKQAEININSFISNFNTITKLLKDNFIYLYIVYGIFFTIGAMQKISHKKLIVSALLAISSVIAGYMLIIATYIPQRCFLLTTIFLIIACGILVPELIKTKYKIIPYITASIITILFLFSFVEGGMDILNSKYQVMQRENYIEEQKKQGNLDIDLNLIKATTKYSAFYDTVDLQINISDTWPNSQMSKFYDLNSITGIE